MQAAEKVAESVSEVAQGVVSSVGKRVYGKESLETENDISDGSEYVYNAKTLCSGYKVNLGSSLKAVKEGGSQEKAGRVRQAATDDTDANVTPT